MAWFGVDDLWVKCRPDMVLHHLDCIAMLEMVASDGHGMAPEQLGGRVQGSAQLGLS